jgi:autotransporter-associated beta strand protein
LVVLDDTPGTINLPNTLTINHQNSVLNMTVFVGNNHPANGGNNPTSATTGATVAFSKVNWTNLNNGQGLTGIGNIEGANGYRLKFNQVDLPAFPAAFSSLTRWTGRFCPNSAPVTLAGTIQQLAGTAAPAATQPILGLDGTNANNFIEGEIRDAADYPGNSLTKPLQVNKTSTSTWTLTGTNTYSGPTIIESGTLVISSLTTNGGGGSALGAPTTVANGTIHIGTNTVTATLRYIGTGHTSDRVINLPGTTGGATLEQAGSGLWKFTSDFTATGAGKKTLTLGGSTAGSGEIAGAIVDNSGINTTSVAKVGSGTWILSGLNTYQGTTTVAAGTLLINGSVTSPVIVSNGATLGGIGAISRNVTIASGGNLTPGIGTLTVSTNVTVANGGALNININGATSGQLSVSKVLTITGATLNFITNAVPDQPVYIIATYGTRVGTFGATNGLPANYSLDYNYNSGTAIAIVGVVPPPATPTNLVATAGDTQVTLSWSAVSGAATYNIKRALVNGGPYTTIQSQAGTSYNNTGLTNGVTYYYVVSAVNGGGESANSTQASATPFAVSLPFTQWQIAKFGSSAATGAGITADPDGNGFVNLLEYAFDRNPTATNTTPLVTAATETSGGQRYVVLTFLRRKDDVALDYIPQVSGNLATWNTGAAHAELLSVTDLDAVREEVQYRIKGPISQTGLQYTRVLVALSGYTNAAAVYAAQRQILTTGQNFMAAPVALTTHTLGALLATNDFPAGDTEANATVVDLWDQAGRRWARAISIPARPASSAGGKPVILPTPTTSRSTPTKVSSSPSAPVSRRITWSACCRAPIRRRP